MVDSLSAACLVFMWDITADPASFALTAFGLAQKV